MAKVGPVTPAGRAAFTLYGLVLTAAASQGVACLDASAHRAAAVLYAVAGAVFVAMLREASRAALDEPRPRPAAAVVCPPRDTPDRPCRGLQLRLGLVARPQSPSHPGLPGIQRQEQPMSPRRKPNATRAVPLIGLSRTPCCGIELAMVPRYELVTPDLSAVTCLGRRAVQYPVRDLVEVVLTTTRQLRPPHGRPFRPHGDDDGHCWDQRCALCTGDVHALADAVTAALVAAFPDTGVARLRATKRLAPGLPTRGRSPLRNLVGVLLVTTTARSAPADTKLRPHRGHGGHFYDRRCALCTGDA
ncbi:hypothetical protein ACFU6S_06300 [Streptomyces sp. NPDC057456]|uniref:hypothetical protein n=1 Tax=Streptomyces sp. NPDC057456 TaxID=3346139 RepID=UPI00367F7B5F